MRLFIGIEFPPQVLTALADCQGKLRATTKRGRFKRQENFHLTLKFLGEVADDRVGAFAGPLSEVAGTAQPFSLRLGRLGRFGSGSPVRVVWVDVAGDTEALSELQARVAQAAAGLGFAPENRPWRPHITLAQDVEPAGESLALAEELIAPAAFRVSEFALVLSEERDRRRIYTPIQRFVLGGCR
ncbi:MAG: RNA 2',3'-cyclic phosphodiesterase [Negativicutes bacterium]|nr:RNA 2',3'-cyclic phosphodiesterase [Negativicutes bacterium]